MNWFQRGRPRAMGVLFSGNAGGYMIAPVVAALIVQFGWRGTLVIAAFAILIIGLPMAFVLRDRPEPYGLYPDGIDPEEAWRRAGARLIPPRVDERDVRVRGAALAGVLSAGGRDHLRRPPRRTSGSCTRCRISRTSASRRCTPAWPSRPTGRCRSRGASSSASSRTTSGAGGRISPASWRRASG